MENQPHDPNQGQLFTEHKVHTVHEPADGLAPEVHTSIAYRDQELQPLEAITPTFDAAVATAALEAEPSPAPAAEVAGVTDEATPSLETGIAASIETTYDSKVSRGLSRLARFFEKSAEVSEKGMEKARRFTQFIGRTIVSTQATAIYANEQVRSVYQKGKETWQTAGSTTPRRIGNLGMRAAQISGAFMAQQGRQLETRAEDKVVDLLTERKRRRSGETMTGQRAA